MKTQSFPISFFVTTVYDIYVHKHFSYPHNKRKRKNQLLTSSAAAALRAFALRVSTCNSRFRIFAFASRSSVLSRSLSSCRAGAATEALPSYKIRPISLISTSNFVHERRTERTSEMYVDAEREGGITSAGVKGAETEVDRGSLATLVNGGAMIGDKDGVCADCGDGAVEDRVGPGPGPGAGPEPKLGREVEDAEAAAETAPVSRETSLREIALPEKNSPAVREGSIEGAGGKMSDWKESDFVGTLRVSCVVT